MGKLLMIIDLQKGFINEHTKSIVNQIKEYIQDNHYKHIIATKFINKNSNYERLLSWNGMKKSDEQEFMIDANDIRVIEKSTYNSCTKEVEEYIKEKHITEVDIVGVDTDACVMATALSIFDMGVKPVILKDMCASSGGDDIHNMALILLKRNIGKNQIK